MIREAINKLVNRENLSQEESSMAMNEIMSGEATPAQISSFITALRMKGETIDEITGCAKVMREKVMPIKTDADYVVDTCGTGGDNSHTFNISTISALVAAGAGVRIAKHGNRAVSSDCGSADVLKALGVNIDADADKVSKCIDEVGIGFLFAPLLHPAMKYAITPRREIGIRTIFNILGPLTNPASAKGQVLGVYDEKLTEPLAYVLKNLGSEHVFVVHGADGLDEMTITDKTFVSELKGGMVHTYTIAPEDFGIHKADRSELIGGTIDDNAKIVLNILNGEKGAKRDIVLLNAGTAIVAGGKASDIKEGIYLAEESIDSGKALQKLEMLIKYSA
ncbi:TPA: anthranilate phosphoribosyltransferase [Candidatus Poribacteria bacterium]|nr:anthranilate phosphoribosyltransferase [Candidatus Poribacteria bacterium]